MASHSRFIPLLSASAILAAGALLAGCGGGDESFPSSSRTIQGQSQSAFGGTVSTWAQLDANNQVTEVGADIPLATIQNASGEVMAPVATLSFPAAVQNSTFINHMEINWNEHGHPPVGVYDKPHFDFHFYHTTPDQVMAVNCTDMTAPPQGRVPQGYALPPLTAENCVPMMGFHASPGSDFAPGFDFQKTMILGYYGGNFDFVEPMVTRDFLLQKQDFSMSIPAPQNAGVSTRFPTKFTADFDESANAYHFIFSDFVNIQ